MSFYTVTAERSLREPKQVQDPDSFLLRQAQEGRQEALTELYRRHERRAYNFALRTTGNPWDAADVAQEAFIKAFRNLKGFKGEALFSTWLHRIVANTAYDFLRRRQAEPMDAEILNDLSSRNEGAAALGSGHDGIDPALDGLSETMRAALLSLKEDFRFTIVLCDLLGFSYAEAAEILEVQEGTIKSRIFRARDSLAAALRDSGYDLPASAGQPTSPPRNLSQQKNVKTQT